VIREADNLACQSWNEKMWSDGGPIDPSPTIAMCAAGRENSIPLPMRDQVVTLEDAGTYITKLRGPFWVLVV
jgi:hypothetical protein